MNWEQKENQLEIMFNLWQDQKSEWEQAKENGNVSENYLDELYIRYRFNYRCWLRLFNELYPPEDQNK